MSKNKVIFGFKNVHIAFRDDTATDQPAWEEPIKIPGAVSFSPNPEGENTPFYADDIVYYVASSNNGYTGDLTMANLPDEILARMLGWKIDENGMLVEIADGKPEKFALMGEVQGDARNRRFVYYDVQANRPTREKQTKTESTEPSTITLPVTISPIEINGKMIVKGDIELNDNNETVFNSFFDSVYVPTFVPEV